MKTSLEKRAEVSVLGTGSLASPRENQDREVRDRTDFVRKRARRVAVSIRGGRIVFVPIIPNQKNEGP